MKIELKLISIIYNIPLQNITYIDKDDRYDIWSDSLFNWSDGGYGRYTNLNLVPEIFANKCKIWAKDFNFTMYSSVTKDGGKCCIHNIKTNPITDISFRGNTESEATVKASESILKYLIKEGKIK